MINRVLIRIRVVQILFAYNQSTTNDLKKASSELLHSLQKSYDLYNYFLSLFVELTCEYERRIEVRKSRLLPTEEDINPNVKLLKNKFVEQLKVNKQLQSYMDERPFEWCVNDVFMRNVLDKILASDIYKEYTTDRINEYESDREFWRKVFKQIICTNEDLYTLLEDECLYWNDDIEIVESFVIKTIKRFEENSTEDQELLPMFRDDSDKEFALELLRESILNSAEYRTSIDKYTTNWESERIAIMDMIIMQIAIAEIRTFPSIPISVTLNEYIDIAKSYSTEKSASFINGVLDAIVKELKENKLILKNK